MAAEVAEHVDVLIVGAGISGIGAAYRIHERNPQLSYVILERRAQIGGTWDLFRYPGVRSDSDIYTLCFPWEPWTRPEMIADGEHIWQYLADTARKHHIDEHIRLNTYVHSVDWNSDTDTWTVNTRQDGAEKTYRCRFLFLGTGYYDYDNPYQPPLPGIEDFTGEVVHPQHWPESFDYTGKRIVVIGSGATAVSLIPSLAQEAAHVTMLQRTPSYMISAVKEEPTANALRRALPLRLAHWIVRWRNAFVAQLIWIIARKAPKFSKRALRRIAERNLPEGYPIDTHFAPPYDPWDQRLCFIVEADLYKAISDGGVEVVTDHIDHLDATGIMLKSGRHIDADVVITATGLQLQAFGGITVSIDGEKIDPHDHFLYRRHMLDGVPNMAWSFGYINASWTLGADLTARAVAKLLEYMHARGYTHAYPRLGETEISEQPTFHLQSGYVLRGRHVHPKSGTDRPWKVSHNFVSDALRRPLDRIDESMVFGRTANSDEPQAVSRG
ncbi:FAD-dependent oxidoreductase [Mycobacterium sp. GA-1285]|uniref:flavin-containing monooxygenase n=1 Tax=Mycobacterium sp. GA-1285 TaxID=1772282 RepID=UPI00074742DE|nr:NAD(P)/FAD-dependent oxidoreductase [Mycobacterium sp. GA-1285]KUI22819.1 FAD-dependent oxidoreductase [Mycobacterium sp. GA-1285]